MRHFWKNFKDILAWKITSPWVWIHIHTSFFLKLKVKEEMVPFALCLDELPVHFIHLKQELWILVCKFHANWLPESSCTEPKTRFGTQGRNLRKNSNKWNIVTFLCPFMTFSACCTLLQWGQCWFYTLDFHPLLQLLTCLASACSKSRHSMWTYVQSRMFHFSSFQ